jgi:hypothetical protein
LEQLEIAAFVVGAWESFLEDWIWEGANWLVKFVRFLRIFG